MVLIEFLMIRLIFYIVARISTSNPSHFCAKFQKYLDYVIICKLLRL